MIIPLGGLLLGIVIGILHAARKGGKPADMAQWAVVYGVILALIGLFVMIGIDRAYLARQ